MFKSSLSSFEDFIAIVKGALAEAYPSEAVFFENAGLFVRTKKLPGMCGERVR